MVLTESKQVGNISYMFDDLDVMDSILDSGCIKTSSRKERNPYTNKEERFVSFSRNLTSAGGRNPKRWRFGIIIDGDRLSDKYTINPISYVGSISNKIGLRIKYIMAYDNNTYSVNFVNWNTVDIPQHLYNTLIDYIEDLPESIKITKKLEHTGEGIRSYRGRKVKEKYLFNNPNGGPVIKQHDYPELFSDIAKSNGFNETEERVWCGDNLLLDVSDYIIGLILPKSISNKELEIVRNMMKNYFVNDYFSKGKHIVYY